MSTDKDGVLDKADFESRILPIALPQIEQAIKKTKYFSAKKYSEFIATLLNIIVIEAKPYGFKLKRIGQNEKYILTNQLEFYRE